MVGRVTPCAPVLGTSAACVRGATRPTQFYTDYHREMVLAVSFRRKNLEGLWYLIVICKLQL